MSLVLHYFTNLLLTGKRQKNPNKLENENQLTNEMW